MAPTFKALAVHYLENGGEQVDTDFIYARIGGKSITEIDVEELRALFADLYTFEKLRGAVLAARKSFIIGVFRFALDCGILSEMPEITHRNTPPPNLFYPPDEQAMHELLLREEFTPAGIILRLAWYCGLLRSELTLLTWQQVDLENNRLILPDRSVPLSHEMVDYLKRLSTSPRPDSDYVLVSRRGTAPLAQQSVSALARRALDSAGQSKVRLNDLRISYIVGLLRRYDWERVSYISGVDLPALQQHYAPYSGRERLTRGTKAALTPKLHGALSRFMDAEDTSLVGLALRFVWQLGVPISVLPLLRWEQIDFIRQTAIFRDREAPIPEDFLELLLRLRSARTDGSESLLLNDRGGKPTDAFYIQKAVQQALIRAGITGVTLSTLYRDYWRKNFAGLQELLDARNTLEAGNEFNSMPKKLPAELRRASAERLLAHLRENGPVDAGALAKALGLERKALAALLRDCRARGELVRVGFRYALPGVLVPAEEQKAVILSYLGERGPAGAAELAALLGLEGSRQLYWVINPLLKDGSLLRAGRNNYCLPVCPAEPETA